MHCNRLSGFTLAELLIALAILGVIATFTIPKILSAQRNEQFNTATLETVSTISGVYQTYKLSNQITSSFGIQNLTNYLNFIAVDTVSTIDLYQTGTTQACNISGGVCLRLHNGSYLQYWPGNNFAGTDATNAVPFMIDPDGKVTDGTTNGPGKATSFWLYADGRVVDGGNTLVGTTYSGGSGSANTSRVPPWFHW